MFKSLGTFLLTCLLFQSTAQSVQWASKVMSFSSEYADPLLGKEYRALHILGRPSKYPKFEASPSAWQSLTPDNPSGEFIIVSFDTAKVIKQVAIFENYGAGSITRVDALDENNKIFLLKEFSQGYAQSSGQITRIRLPNPSNFKVKSIKISMNSLRVQGFSQLDAVAISDSELPIEDKIKLESDPNAYLVKENLGTGINSKFNEICPVVSPDGKRLYFTRWKHPDNLGAMKNQDIWVAQLGEKNKWEKATL
ncbi:MAG: hypothetical protein RLZZ185_1686, partial [Bacteroidota bacterium]